MQLYRLRCSLHARQLTGEGARLFGGRWNWKGDDCLYTSAMRSLCILEHLATVSLDNLMDDITMTVYNFTKSWCRQIPLKDLPVDWQDMPAPISAKQFGSTLLADSTCVCFAIPSVNVHAEQNSISVMAAEGFEQLKIAATEILAINDRIKK